MQIIKRFLRKDIIVIGEDEMDAIDWNTVERGCIYLDIWGTVHLEINNRGFQNKLYNTNLWHLFVRQDLLYQKLPLQLLRACRAKPATDLMGARQFIFNRKHRILIPSNVGILPWDYMKKRGDIGRNPFVGDIRRNAFEILFSTLDDVAARLGARFGLFPTATIPDEKMKRYGCEPCSTRSFRGRIMTLALTFPARHIRMYIKWYE